MPVPIRPLLTRRALLASAAGLTAAGLAGPARAQTATFSYDDVVRRARSLAAQAFDASLPALPAELAGLDAAAYGRIRFRPERALLGEAGGPFRLQLFHLGGPFRRPVTVNLVRDGIATPVPYNPALFDLGGATFPDPLPVDLGFAGFRLHAPLNGPGTLDELMACLGGVVFRFLGRGQRYGATLGWVQVSPTADASQPATQPASGQPALEVPFLREAWVETPGPDADRVSLHGVLDCPSLAAAFKMELYPAPETAAAVTLTLVLRRAVAGLGVSPVAAMYLSGEDDPGRSGDYRPEVHDADGLLLHTGAGEWLWRPLNNPEGASLDHFGAPALLGFGLLQRDRAFDHFQDLDGAYERHPSYWVEPTDPAGSGPWQGGRVDLAEAPTADTASTNVLAAWVPARGPAAGETMALAYRVTALGDGSRLHPGGKVAATLVSPPATAGDAPPGPVRFLVDFEGGDLGFYADTPDRVEVVASTSAGAIASVRVVPNPALGGFRAVIDATVPAGQTADLRAFLKAGARTLTETWTFPWAGR